LPSLAFLAQISLRSVRRRQRIGGLGEAAKEKRRRRGALGEAAWKR